MESERIWIIGGNVGDSVTKRPLLLDARGFLRPTSLGGETVFAIMQDRIGSPQFDSPDVGPGTTVSQPLPNEGVGATLQGFDADFDCSQHLSKAKAAGIKFICRYYSHSPGKNLSPSEALLICSAGISVVAVWETAGDHAAFFSFKQGVDDATSASNQAQTIGQPVDSAIYFAVDFDASPTEIDGGITDYFKGVQQGLTASMPGKATYSVGVYGSGLTCDTLFRAGLVQHTWLAMSSGFRGSKTYTSWNIKQSLDTDLLGLGQSHKVDPDVSHNAANGGLGAFTVALGGILGNF